MRNQTNSKDNKDELRNISSSVNKFFMKKIPKFIIGKDSELNTTNNSTQD
jgi:hypothetical protein